MRHLMSPLDFSVEELDKLLDLANDIEAHPEDVYKRQIYISALTQLNIDEHNPLSTTYERRIRRIVRDAQMCIRDSTDAGFEGKH